MSRNKTRSDRSEATSAEEVAASFHPANRAGYNYVHLRQWELVEKSLANPWTPDHPDGVSVELAVEKSSRLILSSDRVQSQPELSRERPHHAQRGCRVHREKSSCRTCPPSHVWFWAEGIYLHALDRPSHPTSTPASNPTDPSGMRTFWCYLE
ncbi:hypothetical protein L209DRAFT_178537 [Thermothelomyces heterothallicus CBS 203.75]